MKSNSCETFSIRPSQNRGVPIISDVTLENLDYFFPIFLAPEMLFPAYFSWDERTDPRKLRVEPKQSIMLKEPTVASQKSSIRISEY